MNNAVGGLELSSVSKGFFAADAMLKEARVSRLLSRTICPGKYMIIVSGGVAEVKSSVEAGERAAAASFVDSFILANIHPEVVKAVGRQSEAGDMKSLGIVEGFSVSAVIEAADAAVKAATVNLMELRLAMALGGRAFFTFNGSVAAVETAAKAASEVLSRKGLLAGCEVIAQPRKEILEEFV